VFGGLFSLAAVAAREGVQGGPVAGPRAPLAPITADKVAEYFKDHPIYSGRKNGVRLEAIASVAGQRDTPEIRVKWTLDYTGPRHPLIILEPSLSHPSLGQTSVVCGAVGRDKRVYLCTVSGREYSEPGLNAPGRNRFLTLPKGETGTGTVDFPAAVIRDYYRKHWPEQFGDTPPELRVKLAHWVTERGEGFGLDAWTGQVNTGFLRVDLPKW
jgi:hypothetical protein